MTSINEYFVQHLSNPRPYIVCADGFTMSVQASSYHYCKPRSDDANVYTHVEIGYPSAVEPALMPYVEDASAPTDTVYAYVPVEVVDIVIESHGGMA